MLGGTFSDEYEFSGGADLGLQGLDNKDKQGREMLLCVSCATKAMHIFTNFCDFLDDITQQTPGEFKPLSIFTQPK